MRSMAPCRIKVPAPLQWPISTGSEFTVWGSAGQGSYKEEGPECSDPSATTGRESALCARCRPCSMGTSRLCFGSECNTRPPGSAQKRQQNPVQTPEARSLPGQDQQDCQSKQHGVGAGGAGQHK